MRHGRLRLGLASLVVLAQSAVADEVMDAIDEGIKAYKAGEYTNAASQLDYAAQLVRQLKGAQIRDFLPKPLAGWTADDATAEAAGAALFGGGVSTERRYRSGQKAVTAQITGDSPLLQGLMMMFANPAFATQGGGRLQTIKGQKALIKLEPAASKGEISLIVGQRYLVQISGTNVGREDLVAYAEAVDYDGLLKLQ
jgi:hypothetical protein